MTKAQATLGPGGQVPQLIPRSQQEREEDFRAEHRAVLNVKVTDASGHPVMDLKPEDFTLYDNSKPRAIASVQVVEQPAPPAMPRVVLLLDVLNQSPHQFAKNAAAVRRYFMESHGELASPTAIAVLSNSGLKIGEASENRLSVLEQLDTMTHGAKVTRCTDLANAPIVYSQTYADRAMIYSLPGQAPNCLNQRFLASVSSLEHLALKEENTLGRLILVWIGPGWPGLSGKQFVPETPQLKENHFEHLVLLSTAMLQGWVTLEDVSVRGMSEFPNKHDVALSDGVAKEKDVASESLSLPTLARQSGGQVLDEGDDLLRAIAQCMEDARFYYVLSFDFPASESPHQFHSLEVKVNRPGVSARTTTVYYAEP